MINENSLSNLLIDIDFLDSILRQNGREHLCVAFDELRTVRFSSFRASNSSNSCACRCSISRCKTPCRSISNPRYGMHPTATYDQSD